MKRLILGAAAVLCLGAAPALADGMPTRGTTKAYESERVCSVSGSVAVTSEHMFRGISKSAEDASLQGGLELSCGRFYVGVAGAGGSVLGSDLNFSAGYRAAFSHVNVDLGVTHYTFQGGFQGDALDFTEFKAAANAQAWRGGTVNGSVAYTSDYFGVLGDVLTYEVGFAQALPNVGIFSPTFSAAYGYSDFQDIGPASYAFWNAGVTLGFREKWSLDLRYHDTDGEGLAAVLGPLTDERFVATLRYTF
jgi:uncharacterized protein (TIGR02001 family)